jgi:hypothetical protein
MTAPSTAEPDVRRNAVVPWAFAGLVGAAIIIVLGNTNLSPGENGGLAPALVTAAICLVLTAVLFFVVLPRYNGTTTQIVLAVLSVLSLVGFWSGAPAVFGAATAAAARRPSGSIGVAGWVGIVAAVLAVAVTVFASFD